MRFVYRGNNNTFANDVEPEYIAYNTDETKAYIGLQVKVESLFNFKWKNRSCYIYLFKNFKNYFLHD